MPADILFEPDEWKLLTQKDKYVGSAIFAL